MALLVSDNSIVTTYPLYVVSLEHEAEAIYNWLRHYSLVGIGTTYSDNGHFSWRVYAKIKPEIEVFFRMKFNVLEKRGRGYKQQLTLNAFQTHWEEIDAE